MLQIQLDYKEANGRRYMAGNVVRYLRKKIESSVHPLQMKLGLCLSDLEEDIGKLIIIFLFQFLQNYLLF